MLVYFAYGLLVLHVTFGALQAEVNPLYVAVVGAGLVIVLGLHLCAAFKETPSDREVATWTGRHVLATPSSERSAAPGPINTPRPADDGFVDACAVAEIPEKRGRIICLSGERVAIFKYDGKISAVSNVCQHQNGPLGEGKILDGCITCPWHGYQYVPETGASPPPFVEKVPTFNVRVKRGRVFVHPNPNPAGHRAEPARVEAQSPGGLGDEVLASAPDQ